MTESCNLPSVRIVTEEFAQIIVSSNQDYYITKPWIENFIDAVESVNNNNNIKLIEFVGSEKYFCAGASLDFLLQHSEDDIIESVLKIPELILKINAVTIANMFGHAIGGGLALGLWSDLPCLSASSLYGANFITMGFTPGMGSTFVLEDFFGVPLAHEMLFTGQLFKGKFFKQNSCPISTRVYSREEHEGSVKNLIDSILEIKKLPILELKKVLATRKLANLKQILSSESHMHSVTFKDSSFKQDVLNGYLKNYD